VKLDTRWLDWEPEKFEKSPGAEPAKTAEMNIASFAGSTSSQNEKISAPEAEPLAYEDAFDQWARSRCVFRDRSWGGIAALHVDYARWCDQTGRDVPASRKTFEWLLRDQGLWINEGFICGLLLKEDV
jgi:hypothetical protein